MAKPSLPEASNQDGNDKPAPRDRIVEAALVCMERDGIEACSIRNIARQAGVNSAAISYYFGSKEQLIAIAMGRSLDNFGEMINDLDRLLAEGVSLEEALVRVFDGFAANVCRAPRLSYAHLRDALVNQNYDGPAIAQGLEFLEQLALRLTRAVAGSDPAAVQLKLVTVWSNLILLALLPRLFESFVELDLDDAESRARFVAQLLEPLLEHLRQSRLR